MAALVAATIVFFLIVVLLATMLRRVGRAARARIPGAATASGVVVGEVVRQSSSPSYIIQMPLHFPQVRFTAHDGRESTFTAHFGTTLRTKVGQVVQVLYDPADPSRAQIAPESLPKPVGCWLSAMWAFLGVFTVLGLAGLTIAWFVASRLD